jgi:hypothetical protein
VLLLVLAVLLATYWKGWINTIVMCVLVTVDIVISTHLVVYNVVWMQAARWLVTDICCDMPDVKMGQMSMDGNLCPLRWTWLDCSVGAGMIVLFMPYQFFRREQCLPMWCCCRNKAKRLQMYRDQKDKKNYGITIKTDEVADSEQASAEPIMRPSPRSASAYDADRHQYNWMSPAARGGRGGHERGGSSSSSSSGGDSRRTPGPWTELRSARDAGADADVD